MTTPACPSYAGHRFLAEIVSYAVWLYFRFPLSLRNVDEIERRIFAEALPGVAVPRARRTVRLTDRLAAVGVAFGGAAGARLGRKLGLIASRNTLLRPGDPRPDPHAIPNRAPANPLPLG